MNTTKSNRNNNNSSNNKSNISSLSNISEIKCLLIEEQSKNNMLLLHIKSVEDNFKALSQKYTTLTEKHQELISELSSLSRINSDMKKNNQENKYKYDDLISLNCDLRNRISSYENTVNNHDNDLKSIMKKNETLTSKLNELIKENKVDIGFVNLPINDKNVLFTGQTGILNDIFVAKVGE